MAPIQFKDKGMGAFINTNPELNKPQGSYFGICVTDGYDWNQCYSWAWECDQYFESERTAWECFPDVPQKDEVGFMHQIIAICEKLTDMPKKRFFKSKLLEDRG